MEIPFQITFTNVPESDSVWIAVQKRVEKLERHFHRITRCAVTVSCPHKHRRTDRLFHIQVRLSIPGEDVFIHRNAPNDEAHRDVYVAIRDAFDAADRVLHRRVHELRGETGHKMTKPRLARVP